MITSNILYIYSYYNTVNIIKVIIHCWTKEYNNKMFWKIFQNIKYTYIKLVLSQISVLNSFNLNHSFQNVGFLYELLYDQI